MKPSGIITLLTDFGFEGPYVAAMKGVILSIHPGARLIDITHQVTPGDVCRAALLLQEAVPFFPPGTIHLAVVDPGVGSRRRAMAAAAADGFFVGPDNGIFWPVLEDAGSAEIINLTESRYFLPRVSHTFHGRDIFAPAAAHLSLGLAIRRMGPAMEDPVRLDFPKPRLAGGVLTGEVLRADRFGNLITNIDQKTLADFTGVAPPLVRVGGLEIEGLVGSYSEKPEGELLALIGSSGRLEISVNRGRASDKADGGTVEGIQVRVFCSKGGGKRMPDNEDLKGPGR